MDKDVIFNKIESLRRCVTRIEGKVPASCETMQEDYDLQDIIVLNLERAVQNCVDIASHLVADEEIPAPDTMVQAFEALHKAGCISRDVTERMSKAVGFRNIVVHSYQDINWDIVFSIITRHLDDFREFAQEVLDNIK